MPQGLDRRQAVQDRLASAEQAQLTPNPLTPTMSPRPASAAGVGAGAEALGQAFRSLGTVVARRTEKEKGKDQVLGEVAYAQGRTLSELEAEGASKATIAGFQAIDAQTQASAYFADQMSQIEQADHALDPLDYRGALSGRLNEMIEGLDPETARLVSAHAARQMPRLAEAQMRAHFAYRGKETFSSAVAMAATASADPEAHDAIDFVFSGDPDSPIAALSPEKQAEAVTEAVLRGFSEDDPAVHGLFTEKGVYDRFNLTSRQKNSIRAAEQAYEGRIRAEYDAEFEKTSRQIVSDVREGNISVEEGLARQTAALAERGIKMKRVDAGDIFTADDARNREIKRAEQKALEDARKKAEAEIEGLQWGAFQIEKETALDDLREGRISPAQYEERVMSAHKKFEVAIDKSTMGELAGELMAAERKRIKAQVKEDKIMMAVRSNDIINLPKDEQQRAFEIVENEIGSAYGEAVVRGQMSPEEAVERTRQDFIEWSMNTGIVNTAEKNRLHAALSGDLLDREGQPRDDVMEAVADLMTMHQANPRMAEKYMSGEAEDIFALVESNMLVSGDLPNAIKAATAQLSAPDTQERIEAIQSPETQERIASAAEGWIDDQSFSVVGALLRGDADVADYFNVFSGEQDRAMEQAGVLRSLIERQAEARMLRTRGMTADAAVRAAARDIEGRVALMGGDVVLAPKGQDIKSLMFGGRAPDFDVDNVENTALMTYLSEFGASEEMWGEDFNGETLSRIFLSGDGPTVLGVTIPDTLYNPLAAAGAAVDAAREAARGVPEIRVSAVPSYSGQEPGVMVEYRKAGGDWSPDIRFVPYKDIGDFYIESRKAQFQ